MIKHRPDEPGVRPKKTLAGALSALCGKIGVIEHRH
jgi:hypothetical protein